jgi:hypothetical protein
VGVALTGVTSTAEPSSALMTTSAAIVCLFIVGHPIIFFHQAAAMLQPPIGQARNYDALV